MVSPQSVTKAWEASARPQRTMGCAAVMGVVLLHGIGLGQVYATVGTAHHGHRRGGWRRATRRTGGHATLLLMAPDAHGHQQHQGNQQILAHTPPRPKITSNTKREPA